MISRETGKSGWLVCLAPLFTSRCQEFQRDGCWPSSYVGIQGDLERYTVL